ncbi:MAG: TolC family protein, partial [Neisseriaceae bacterium]|nr:TolC family protein [Neisseriaceae bacterium]
MTHMTKLTLTLMSALVAGCASVSVTPPASQVNLPSTYEHERADALQAQGLDLARWWQAWGDAELAQLIEQGLANNLDVAMAQTRIKEAEALATMVSSRLYPNVGVDGGVQRQRSDLGQSPLRGTPLAPLIAEDTRYQTHRSIGVSALWEVDVFGGNHSDAAAAKEGVLGAQQQAYGTQMLVAAGIAEHYLAARALEQRMAIMDEGIHTVGQLLRYVQGRFNAGQVTRYEVSNVAASLAGLEAQRAPLQALRDRHVRQIAVLLGQTPQGFRLGRSQGNVLASLPPAPQG